MVFGFAAKKEVQSLRLSLGETAQKLNELEKRYNSTRAVFESMVEGVITVDKDARIVSLNPPAEKLFNLESQEAAGKFFLEAFRNNDIAEIISRVLETGQFISQEVSLVWPMNKTFQVNASAIFDKGNVSGCLLVIHDVTEIRRLENMRRDFVANVSHELKTPLTSIKGFVETLLEGAWEDKQNCRHFLEIIRSHANRLDSLVNDLLELSSLESKGIAINKQQARMKKLTDDILAGFRAHLKKKSIIVTNDLPVDLMVVADEEKIGQVLTNLIDNAIKFNRPNGTVRIYGESQAKRIKLSVEDSGIGIPPKDIPRIFERFYRVDKARSRELGGTGLGLSIVKHIVELHGGEVGVESTEGFGSKFWFTLPQ